MKLKYRGEELTKEEREEVAKNLHISRHCRDRLAEREYVNVYDLIRNPMLAYFNTDGSMNFALDRYNYLVVVYDPHYKNFNAITWKEMSWYKNDIFYKRQLAIGGYERKND